MTREKTSLRRLGKKSSDNKKGHNGKKAVVGKDKKSFEQKYGVKNTCESTAKPAYQIADNFSVK